MGELLYSFLMEDEEGWGENRCRRTNRWMEHPAASDFISGERVGAETWCQLFIPLTENTEHFPISDTLVGTATQQRQGCVAEKASPRRL